MKEFERNLGCVSLGLDKGGRSLVHDVDFKARAGEVSCIVGPSGSGKTTLLNCLGLLEKPHAGFVCVNGVDASKWNRSRRREFWRSEVSFVLQDYGVIEEESLAYNVTLHSKFFSNGVSGNEAAIEGVLERVGLHGRASDVASILSGGEKQRLGIARALYRSTPFALVDEPTASLDEENVAVVVGLLNDLANSGSAVVVSTHDQRVSTVASNVINLGDFS